MPTPSAAFSATLRPPGLPTKTSARAVSRSMSFTKPRSFTECRSGTGYRTCRPKLAKLPIFALFFATFFHFWRARSRLYQNEILQVNMRLTAFFKLYKTCILLHRCNLKIFAKNRFEKLRISQNFWKFSQIFANSTNFLKKMWFWSCAKECIV